ncbi:UvrD-helicase domain-containing protein [Corynebacterium sphenisci]|uniref:UvrD-helicase domain-containing protein n=1 Tax=Corynebacterium sphenisci TaxID=191493 RepID=UPI0026E061A6|nr:UvrD-helicase domain-containing protein [Corynebacterium sphenisci]MDO5730366.1 UvrD-helicase domain-containing protein [Corynebacterium sphenisci]
MKSTIITASAGSGKTYTITERLAERIAGGLAPAEVIATTFTTKAAEELAERIRGKLLARGLHGAARSVSAALIGTVNSVAARILEDFAIEAGLSPELATLPEQGAEAAFAHAVDDALSSREVEHADLLHRMGYDRPVDAHQHDPRRSWSDAVRRLAEAARLNMIDADRLHAAGEESVAGYLAMLDGVAPARDGDERPEWARRAHRVLGGILALDEGATSKSAAARTRAANAHLRVLDEGVDRVPWGHWAKLDGAPVPAPTKPQKALLGDFAGIGEEIAANPAYRPDAEALIRLIFGTAADSLDAYAAYKRELGLIDFADQEILALRVLRESEAARRAVAEGYRLLVVDEFQDTSPIQLALFFELGQLVGEVIWVGDPKQSIYGFRGSDPQLMNGVLAALRDAPETTLDTLRHSWRSHARPLALSNALFTHAMPEHDVHLDVPEPLREAHAGGSVRYWRTEPHGNRNAPWLDAIVCGTAALLREDGVRPGRVAVLTRSNGAVGTIADALTEVGIPCTGHGRDPRTTRQGHALRAGLGLLVDEHDTRALVELIGILDDHAAHGSWFAELTAGRDHGARRALLREWREDPALAGLAGLRDAAVNLTPVEAVREVADALDLRRRIGGWTDPAARVASLEIIAGMAAEYLEERRAAGLPATLADFLRWYDGAEAPAGAADEDAVYVGTVHSAKGLEWDAVCVATPKPRDRFTPDGVWVHATRTPTLDDPLGGRTVRFWPAGAGAEITAAAREHPEQAARAAAEREDERRLAYVALTRAARDTILCPHSGLDDHPAVAGTGVGFAALDAGLVVHPPTVGGAPEMVPAEIRDAPAGADRKALAAACVAGDPVLPAAASAHDHGIGADELRRDARPGTGPRARVAPSSLAPDPARAEATAVVDRATLGAPVVAGGAAGWDAVGDCVHAYLALPLAAMDAGRRAEAAARLVAAWGVGDRMGADRLVAVGERWTGWVAAEYPGARLRTEVPITWVNEGHQVLEGWIDALIECADGAVVLVDHKSYPGAEPKRHVREEYLGQLAGYADALELAGAGRPAEVLVHLPLLGRVLGVVE